MSGKKIAISVGPIPARMDSVKYITNRFKGGLAVQTAGMLADKGHELTIVAWAFTANTELSELETHPNVKEIVRVSDVFEYYDWFVANAKNFDAFVMAAAVANLTPVKPCEGKFPSHLYKPGEEFDIKFMIAPRAIDAIKSLNPRCCLIGYKLFDCESDGELAEIAKHTLKDAKANIIFANTPKDAKRRKLAVFPDDTVLEVNFKDHVDLIDRAVRQEYFSTAMSFLEPGEMTADVREALATVEMYEKTFGTGYGTVAVPVKNRPGTFATTSRGHKGGAVIVDHVDYGARTVHVKSPGDMMKATLNAPALAAMFSARGLKDWPGIVIHRHDGDPLYAADQIEGEKTETGKYLFPGTVEECDVIMNYAASGYDVVFQEGHGYLAWLPVQKVDWTRYHQLFPDKYFSVPDGMRTIVKDFKSRGMDTLEIGGNRRPEGDYSYDPYVCPEPGYGKAVLEPDIRSRFFPLAFAYNSINYLSRAEIAMILEHCGSFMANTFREAPREKHDKDEYAVLDGDRNEPVVRHGLRLSGDVLMRHAFHAYDKSDWEGMGLSVLEYGKNSCIVYRNLVPAELLPAEEKKGGGD